MTARRTVHQTGGISALPCSNKALNTANPSFQPRIQPIPPAWGWREMESP